MRRWTTIHTDELDRVLAPLESELKRKGTVRLPAQTYLSTAARMITDAQARGWSQGLTPTSAIEERAATKGWACRWEGEELVLEIPGWAPPPVRVVAVQPGLFD